MSDVCKSCGGTGKILLLTSTVDCTECGEKPVDEAATVELNGTFEVLCHGVTVTDTDAPILFSHDPAKSLDVTYQGRRLAVAVGDSGLPSPYFQRIAERQRLLRFHVGWRNFLATPEIQHLFNNNAVVRAIFHHDQWIGKSPTQALATACVELAKQRDEMAN